MKMMVTRINIILVSKTPIYYTKTFSPFATESKGRPGGKRGEVLSPKQTWARLEIVYKIIRTQQALMSKHWKTDQLFDNTFTLIEIGIKHSNSCIRWVPTIKLYFNDF